MTAGKQLKKIVRARARKTGESYTAARRQVLAQADRSRKAAPALPQPRTKAAPSLTRGAVTDAASRKATGRGLDHWFAVLDAFGKEHGHTKAADHLFSAHGVPGWYGQGITVAWERARGLRQENQSCTGTFQVSVSRVVPASVEEFAARWNDARFRARVLSSQDRALVRSLEAAFSAGKRLESPKAGYARMRFKWAPSTVEIRVYGKGEGKASVVADSKDLATAADVEPRRAAFSRALDAVRSALA